MKELLKSGQIFGRKDMKKIMAGIGECGGCDTGCRKADGGSGCIVYKCVNGWCNPEWSNC